MWQGLVPSHSVEDNICQQLFIDVSGVLLHTPSLHPGRVRADRRRRVSVACTIGSLRQFSAPSSVPHELGLAYRIFATLDPSNFLETHLTLHKMVSSHRYLKRSNELTRDAPIYDYAWALVGTPIRHAWKTATHLG